VCLCGEDKSRGDRLGQLRVAKYSWKLAVDSLQHHRAMTFGGQKVWREHDPLGARARILKQT
jgi:hypothetical protein